LTDDDLKIRHVRLCQCGKPADHDSICKPGRSPAGLDPEREVERVPLDWEERRARKREEKFAGVQRELSPSGGSTARAPICSISTAKPSSVSHDQHRVGGQHRTRPRRQRPSRPANPAAARRRSAMA